jgi:hypothetical protein
MIFAAFGADTTASAAAAAAAPSVAPAAAVPATVAPAAAITPPVASTQATRNPFQRPGNMKPGFIPKSLRTQFVPEFEPFPGIMHFPGARLPRGVMNPRASEPGAETPVARPEDQAGLPASIPSPVKMNARMLPPSLIMALGIMPPVQGVRSGRVNPNMLVAAGRKPSGV